MTRSSAPLLLLLVAASASAQEPQPPAEPAPSAPSGPTAEPTPSAPSGPTAEPVPAPSPSAPVAPPAPAPDAAPVVASEPAPPAPASQPATPALSQAPAASTAGPPTSARQAKPAQDPAVDNPLIEDPPPKRAAPDTPRLDAWLGVHGLVISDPGFDAFSEDDALTSFGAGLGAELGKVGGGSLAAVAGISLGGDDASYRGQDAELSVVRLTLGPELRFPFAGRFFGYGRLSPQLVHVTAKLADDSSSTTLEQASWLFGLDTALGVALRLADVRPQGLASPLSIFARLEAGYTWSPDTELSLSPRGGDGPVRSEPVALGDLSLSGASFRVALGVGY